MNGEETSASFQRIPVIDVAPLMCDDEAAARKVAEVIRSASVETGFFYVSGHNISTDVINATYMASKYFFGLREEKKRAISVTANSAHRGYVPFAQTKQPDAKRADLKESFNFAYPFTADHPAMTAGHALIGLNQWPEGDVVWRQIVEKFYDEVFALGQGILGAFALALGMRRDHFRDLYRYPLVRTRLLHYPPMGEATAND